MSMSVSGPSNTPPTKTIVTPTESPNSDIPSQSITPPQNDNDTQKDKHTFLKECRDWLNSVMWGATLATGLYMTYNSMIRSNPKEIMDALQRNDANLHLVLKALGENNKNTATIIEENNEHTKRAIDENTQYLKEVIKVLDKDGDGKLSEAEIKEAQMLMEEAKKWKKFTDAINEATTTKKK